MTNETYGHVYTITNRLNGYKYVGITTQKPESRWKAHLVAYQSRKRVNFRKKLYRAMRDVGIENFTFEIIDTAVSQEELITKEIQYIESFNSRRKGYNKSDGGEGTHSSKKRKVQRLDKLTGEVLETYESVSDAIKWLKKVGGIKTAKQSLYKVLNGKSKTTGGYQWSYVK